MDKKKQIYGVESFRSMLTLQDFEVGMRDIDPKAEVLELGLGRVLVFVEPNKWAAAAEAVFNGAPFGVFVSYLPRPEFLPDPQHTQGRFLYGQV